MSNPAPGSIRGRRGGSSCSSGDSCWCEVASGSCRRISYELPTGKTSLYAGSGSAQAWWGGWVVNGETVGWVVNGEVVSVHLVVVVLAPVSWPGKGVGQPTALEGEVCDKERTFGRDTSAGGLAR